MGAGRPVRFPAPIIPTSTILENLNGSLSIDAPVGTPQETRVAEAPVRDALSLELERRRIEDAVEEGRSRGYSEGLQQGQEEIADIVGRLQRLADDFRKAETHALEQLVPRMTEFAYEAMVKILGRISAEKTGIAGLVDTAIAGARPSVVARKVRLSASDLSLLKTDAPELLAQWEKLELQAVADSRVQTGGCIIEGERGNVDARLETQLGRLGEALTALRRPSGGS